MCLCISGEEGLSQEQAVCTVRLDCSSVLTKLSLLEEWLVENRVLEGPLNGLLNVDRMAREKPLALSAVEFVVSGI